MTIDWGKFPRDINVPGYKMRPAYLHILDRIGTNPLVGAEIGIYLGETAEYALRHLNLRQYIMVDPYKMYGDMQRSQEDWTEIYNKVCSIFSNRSNAQVVREDSSIAASRFTDGYFDFVYIDGDHSYEAVKKDLDAWFGKVRVGGVFCGHDMQLPEVREAVTDFIGQNKLCLHTEVDWYTNVPDWWIDK
jgi:hypothetical protein